MKDIQFKTADLNKDLKTCIKFRQDSFICSFGSEQRMLEEMGENNEKYIDWLIPFAKQKSQAVIHIWTENKIIGQLEFKAELSISEPGRGYINLFYLIPEFRGTEVSALMHQFVINELVKKGCYKARLSVSETNHRAIAFYKKHGWRYVKPREEDSSVHLYQLDF